MTDTPTMAPDVEPLTDHAVFLPSARLGIPAAAEIGIHFVEPPGDGLHMVVTAPDAVSLMARVPTLEAGIAHLAAATAQAAEVLARMAEGASPGQAVPRASGGSRQVYGLSFIAALALHLAKAADAKRTAN